MQYKVSEFNPERHDKIPCLSVKNPYAHYIAEGEKKIELRSRDTKHRGDILICSSKTPFIPGMKSGVTKAFVELYDTVPASLLTREEWLLTKIPEDKWKDNYRKMAWLLRNPRKVTQLPIVGQLGIYNLIYTKGMIKELSKMRESLIPLKMEAGFEAIKTEWNELFPDCEVSKYYPKGFWAGAKFVDEWIPSEESAPIEGEMAIFYTEDKTDAVCSIFTGYSNGFYYDNSGLNWTNAILYQSPAQYKNFIKR